MEQRFSILSGKNPPQALLPEEIEKEYPYLRFLHVWNNSMLAIYRMRCGLFSEAETAFDAANVRPWRRFESGWGSEPMPSLRTRFLRNLADKTISNGDFGSASKWIEKIAQTEPYTGEEFLEKYREIFQRYVKSLAFDDPEYFENLPDSSGQIAPPRTCHTIMGCGISNFALWRHPG